MTGARLPLSAGRHLDGRQMRLPSGANLVRGGWRRVKLGWRVLGRPG